MAYDGSVSAQQAEAARRTKLSVPQKRRVPALIEAIAQVKAARTIHIFNIGPWAHVVNTGSTGSFYIPACPTAKQCAEAGVKPVKWVEMTTTLGGIVDELIVKNEVEMDRLMQDGREFADEILGLGRGANPAYALTRSGCFASENDEPSAEEIEAALKLLRPTCSEIISNIRTTYSTDRKLFQQVVRPEIHYRAAEVLNLEGEVWMLDNSPSRQIKCMGCGAMAEPDVAMCPNGHIVNQELYDKFVAQQEAMSQSAEKRAKRPAAASAK